MDTRVWFISLMLGLQGPAKVDKPALSPAPTPGIGAIEGALLYPACTGLPADLKVCAENAKTGEVTCTQRFVDDGGYRYRLELPKGEYALWAESKTARPGYRAYYSAAIPCGLSVDCKDHHPIPLLVEAGALTTGISPADWFAGR